MAIDLFTFIIIKGKKFNICVAIYGCVDFGNFAVNFHCKCVSRKSFAYKCCDFKAFFTVFGFDDFSVFKCNFHLYYLYIFIIFIVVGVIFACLGRKREILFKVQLYTPSFGNRKSPLRG